MMWFRPTRRKDPEIAPEEIFLDASTTTSTFDRSRFEGRLERPLAPHTFYILGVVLSLLFLVLVSRTWYLEISRGAQFAEQSAHNSLETRILFAPRGVITDVNGEVLVENTQREDGTILRNYRMPEIGQIIGYVSYPKKDSKGNYYDTSYTGVAGLEARYNDALTGVNGQLLTETDALGKVRSEGILVKAQDGKALRLSVDANLERALAGAIKSTARDHGFIAGAGVIMDVTTGAVRAIVSYPSYDPNVMANGSPAATIAAYNSDAGHPFLDHAVQGVYTPGSVVKPIVSAGALTDGIITTSTSIDDPGSLTIPDPYHPGKNFVYKGWKALGLVDVKKAIAWSSDVFFYMVGGGYKSQKGLGIDRLKYWYEQFGLGAPTGVDLSGEASGLIPDPAWKKKVFNEPWYLGDTYFTAIGQYSVQVTPIQMARATAAVANGGKLFTPTLLADAPSSSTSVSVDAHALATVREGMRQGVTSALAQAINLPYVSVAAKTGTAETGTRNQYDNSWVVGFFPYENPRYSFAVVLERGPAGQGERAVDVMAQFFDTLHTNNSPYVGGSGTATSTELP